MECPGSVGLLQHLQLPPSDESEFATEGTAAHHFLETCLREGLDAWEVVGHVYKADDKKIVCNVEMADAIQLFIDTVRPTFEGGDVWIETQIDAPDFHPQFYGTVDCGVLWPGGHNPEGESRVLDVNDFKYGAGIAVDAFENPQLMYYAYGLLRKHPDVGLVRIRIIQPRAYHPDGPVREWEISADDLQIWAEYELRPAMERTATDASLSPGKHCRFCPAKLVCPAMVAMFGAAAAADPKSVVDLSDAAVEANYEAAAAVKNYLKALEEEAFRRLSLGRPFSLIKLVPKKANRVWNPGAAEVLRAQLGDEAVMTKPEFKSPAQIEELGGRAKLLVKEYAHTPESGLTVALASDKRVAVKMRAPSETFAAFVESQK